KGFTLALQGRSTGPDCLKVNPLLGEQVSAERRLGALDPGAEDRQEVIGNGDDAPVAVPDKGGKPGPLERIECRFERRVVHRATLCRFAWTIQQLHRSRLSELPV